MNLEYFSEMKTVDSKSDRYTTKKNLTCFSPTSCHIRMLVDLIFTHCKKKLLAKENWLLQVSLPASSLWFGRIALKSALRNFISASRSAVPIWRSCGPHRGTAYIELYP